MNQEERRQRRQKDTKSAVIVCVIVVLILLVLVAGGVFLVGRLLPKGGGQNEGTDGTELPGENVAATEEVTEQPQTEVQTDPVEEQAAQLVSQMTLEDNIAQMFVTVSYTHLYVYKRQIRCYSTAEESMTTIRRRRCLSMRQAG